MPLPGKERFKENPLKKEVSVTLSINREPKSVLFKHPEKWSKSRELTVQGTSTERDLMPDNIPVEDLSELESANQYILVDNDLNIYQAYIYVVRTKEGVQGFMSAIRTTPIK